MVFQLSVARPERHPADRAQFLEAVGRDLILIRRHHLGDRRRARLERDEQEPAPLLQRDRHQARACRSRSPGYSCAVRHPDQPPVAGIAPRVIGAGQHLGAAAVAVDQPRAAMAADVGEGAHLAVVAADDDHALAEIFEACAIRPARRSRFRGRRPAARRAGTRASPPRRTRGRDRASPAGSCRRAGRCPGWIFAAASPCAASCHATRLRAIKR